MDKCIKKDCVDFDVSPEDMDLAGNCNICNRSRQNPAWVSSEDRYLRLEGKPVNPTDDVPPKGFFTPIPTMEDRRDPDDIFIDETAEISPEAFRVLSNSPLATGWSLNSTQRPLLESPGGMYGMEAEMDANKAGGFDQKKDIKDSGKRTEFSTGAVRDAQGGKGRFDLLPNLAVWALAHHTEKGCEKYGDRNWEKGIPIKNFIDSAKRHLIEFELGLTDENHLAAALWNVACCYETLLRIDMGILPESLNDDLAYPLRGVINGSEMVLAWDRLRHPKLKV